MSENGNPKVGDCCRWNDGIVRWVVHESRRGYFHVRWLDEEAGVWHNGGIYRAGEWNGCVEPFRPPAPGEPYLLMGATGRPREMVAP